MSASLGRLQAVINRIERARTPFAQVVITTGYAPLDMGLPGGGLACRAVHEIIGPAASGFAAGLAGRALQAGRGSLIWVLGDNSRRHGKLYGPGLADFGVAIDRLIAVRCKDTRAVLGAMEDAARNRSVACVVGEIERLDLLASRRLQLAAEAGGGLVLLLRPGRRDSQPLAATTRIEVTPLVGQNGVYWRVDLWRSKGSPPAQWDIVWHAGGAAAARPANRHSNCPQCRILCGCDLGFGRHSPWHQPNRRARQRRIGSKTSPRKEPT